MRKVCELLSRHKGRKRVVRRTATQPLTTTTISLSPFEMA